MTGHQPTRRDAIRAAFWALWGLIAAALGLPSAAYVLAAQKRGPDAEWVPVADIQALPAGAPERVVFERKRVDGWKVVVEKASAWIVRRDDGQVVAFAPHCTHLGCAYHWEQQAGNFVCPCHASAFDTDGRVLAGPAPRPLDRFDVRLDEQKIFVGGLRRSEERS